MANKNILELAKKLKALAEQGEGGEKENASRMLQALMTKHQISPDDIEGEIVNTYWYTVREDQYKLFIQIAFSIKHNAEFWTAKGKRNKTGVDLTPAQAIELDAKFNFYWKLFAEEMETVRLAFIYKHELFSGVSSKEAHEFSQEELEKHKRAQKIAKGFKDEKFLKQLSR